MAKRYILYELNGDPRMSISSTDLKMINNKTNL